MTAPTLRRRSILALMGTTALLPFVPQIARAQVPGVTIIALADLHSAYDRSAQLLAEIARQVTASSGPAVIVLNGDLFELGNKVTIASGGEIDWTMLAAFADLAPTIVNIGNHEPDIDPDLANFVARAQGHGIIVLSNLTDTRSGAGYAPASVTLDLGGQAVTFVGIATDALFTYPAATREMIAAPEPVAWANEHLPALMGPGINVILSHAGVVADRQILPLLPDGALLVGGHDHLDFEHAEGATRYIHTGSWSTAIRTAYIAAPGAAASISRIAIDPAAEAEPRLAALIESIMATHLGDGDRESVGTSPAAMGVDEVGLMAAAALAAAGNGDAGFIGHTSFGAGLPAGAVSRYEFDGSVRFDGKLMAAEVSPEVLAEIMARANQVGDFPLAQRSGDFLYAAPQPGDARPFWRIVTNDWSARNQASYFGREDLEFTEIAGAPGVKDAILAALR
ncbi:MAG: metallophosphoesterase [Paracoccus sp. (in: a-proteobacteria)]|nr:metallophosphoesterase [Paracoccus sp. (in: a-proteobacteria)]